MITARSSSHLGLIVMLVVPSCCSSPYSFAISSNCFRSSAEVALNSPASSVSSTLSRKRSSRFTNFREKLFHALRRIRAEPVGERLIVGPVPRPKDYRAHAGDLPGLLAPDRSKKVTAPLTAPPPNPRALGPLISHMWGMQLNQHTTPCALVNPLLSGTVFSSVWPFSYFEQIAGMGA